MKIKVCAIAVWLALGFEIGVWTQRELFLLDYERAPNFPFLKPTPAYVLKQPPPDYPKYRVVLMPQ